MTQIAFGPVPSRRLGQSLGINNIPPKACTYSCTYCQVGPTPETSLKRREFYPVAQIVAEVSTRVAALRERDERIDFLTFVPDGEPTLDVHLGAAIERLRGLGIPIAVISNGSLTWRDDVRAELGSADWVSVKVDTVDRDVWRRLNQPHPDLQLETVLAGMLQFAAAYRGRLVTETMLVAGVNDDEAAAERTAGFVARLQPQTAYLLVPTRPTASAAARPPDETAVTRCYEAFRRHVPQVELLTGAEPTAFGGTGDAERDLLSTTAVHPMRETAVRELLAKDGASWDVVERLLATRELTTVEYRGERFYVRRFRRPTA
jgi:wyosine [tRNA(Phe)-imidazoG37] synthetase (radical SAM superfamily)